MSQLSEEEKIALKQISAISLKDASSIKDVLFSILSCITINSYDNDHESEFIIPYIAKLKFKYVETPVEQGFESNILIEATPMPSLIKEFVCIKNEETPPSKRYFRKQNNLHLEKLLKMDV